MRLGTLWSQVDYMQLDLTEAFRIAVEVHGAQRDKAGEPYLFHVFRVAEQMDTDEERVVAILHDVIEDSVALHPNAASVEMLRLGLKIRSLYGIAVADAVCELTRGPVEPYLDYIRRLATNPLAVKVKFADLKDNRNRDRLRKLPRTEAERLWDKYEKAWLVLYAAADEAGTLDNPLGIERLPYPGPLPRCEDLLGEDRCVLPVGHQGQHFGGAGICWGIDEAGTLKGAVPCTE